MTQVVVITGASSGIGRAAAHAFARRGARLALAARSAAPLSATAEECQGLGGDAVAVPTDVRAEDQVAALARQAVERFGRIDVWVSCAGVMAYGRFEDVPGAVFRQVIETNLFGQVHAARAVLPQFRRQGTGVLIGMSSVWGRITTPEVSAYVVSKFAVRAFCECLRQELRDTPGISVAAILPAAVDTPIFRRAANYAGRAVRPVPPLFDPAEIAEGIVMCAQDPKREVTYGRLARILELIHTLAPPVYQRLAPEAFAAGNFERRPAAPTDGTVASPDSAPYRIDGGWRRSHRRQLADGFVAAAGGAWRGLWGHTASRGVSGRS